MTTPTTTSPQQAAELFRDDIGVLVIDHLAQVFGAIDEIRAAFDLLHVEISEIRADLFQMREGLAHAAQPAPAVGTFGEMEITTIIMTYSDKGEAAYKATGTPYNKFGVRVWPEVLPVLGVDPAALHPGPNTINTIRARVLMTEPEEGKAAQPRKVTGKA